MKEVLVPAAVALSAVVVLIRLLQGRTRSAREKLRREAGDAGEGNVANMLRGRSGSIGLRGLITTGDLKMHGSRFESDLIGLVEGVGLVVMEVKTYTGVTRCGRGPRWKQVRPNGSTTEHPSASAQVIRTAKLVRRMLQYTEWGRKGKVAVVPVVVWAHPKGKVKLTGEEGTDVVLLEDLPRWFADLRHALKDNGFRPGPKQQEELLALCRRFAH